MGRAYDDYYTHDVPDDGSVQPPKGSLRHRQVARAFKNAVRNDYLNREYGYQLSPALPRGSLILQRLPKLRLSIDRDVRYLRAPSPGARLLDVGCGSGEFLEHMRSLGWEAHGLDPDPQAVRACQRRGIEASLGTLTESALDFKSYDAVTMSHVIEHMHSPQSELELCAEYLKPGGVIYLETPNIASSGYALFGKDWRGLETPRHLVIFNVESLKRAIVAAGLRVESTHGVVQLTPFITQQSMAIRAGRDPYGSDSWVSLSDLEERDLKRRQVEGLMHPERCDVIGVLARL